MNSNNMHSIAHLTSVHFRYDTRIFIKMCSSLASNGYDVLLVVADGKGYEEIDNVKILDVVRKKGGRLSRMTKTVSLVYSKALELDADIYHLHDPELMPLGINLKRKGKKVIFDAHEDLPKQILSKPYLYPFCRKALAGLISKYELISSRKLAAMITATPSIFNKFKTINSRTININNYPLEAELFDISDTQKKTDVAYIGGISEIRGIKQLVSSFSMVHGIRLNLVGSFDSSNLRNVVQSLPGWLNINEHGVLCRSDVKKILASSVAGLVIFLPVANHIESQPNKMFEYMSAGIPVMASNFPRWKEIIEGINCGICVDPLKPKEIAEAINYLVANPEVAKQMGQRGRKAIEEKYNWSVEEQKLLKLYEDILA